MAITCPQCRTQNPDGNSFCQQCGTPLAPIVQAAPAQMMGPPPSLPPPSYQSPYYTPGVATPSVHRTPWVLIVGAVVALIVIMAGCGTAFALLNRNGNQSTAAGGGLPSPSPAGTPSPTVQVSPTAGANGGKVSNPNVSVTLPSGWTVVNKDTETITAINPNGDGVVTIGSGPSSPPQSAQQNKATLDKFFTDKYPDTKACPNSKVTTGSISGASGIFWELCFTDTSGSQSFPAGTLMFAGANSDGSVYYAVILLTPVSNLDSFIAQARPVLATIQWALK